jgi:hypothetical protein
VGGAEFEVAEVGAEFDVVEVGFVTVGLIPVALVLKGVSGDRNTLDAEPIPPLHPQLQSPRVIRRGRNKSNSDLLGLKKVGSDAW